MHLFNVFRTQFNFVLVEFVEQYLAVGRDTYAIVNKQVMTDCDLIVDGTKLIRIILLLQARSKNCEALLDGGLDK
jgi:hypothetical protein